MKRIKLFAFPYAGGSASLFYQWKRLLDSNIALYPIELAGRGKKMNEPFFETVDDAVEAIFAEIEPELHGGNYAFFGHSMGSLLAFELAGKIADLGYRTPLHVFFSARFPPHIRDEDESLSRLTEEELIEKIIKIGGTMPGIFHSKELRNIFLPILKADYRMLETYRCVEKDRRFDFSCSIFRGTDDAATPARIMKEWDRYANKDCIHEEFPGGHFYFNNTENLIRLIQFINEALTPAYSMHGT